jgi:hypothetical protein
MIGLIDKLISLPPGSLATDAQRAAWSNFRANLMPALPVSGTNPNETVIALATVLSSGKHNGEGPELYAMHPHRLFTKGRQIATGE